MMTFVSKVQSQGLIILGWYLPRKTTCNMYNNFKPSFIVSMVKTKKYDINEELWKQCQSNVLMNAREE